jgi:hypothetical protein
MYGNINNCSIREKADQFFAGGVKKMHSQLAINNIEFFYTKALKGIVSPHTVF